MNADGWGNDTQQIVVAAVNAHGSIAGYSSEGAPILVSAFGSEGSLETNDRVGAAVFTANATGLAEPWIGRIIYEIDTGRLFYDRDGFGGDDRMHFATLSAGLALTHADFSMF